LRVLLFYGRVLRANVDSKLFVALRFVVPPHLSDGTAHQRTGWPESPSARRATETAKILFLNPLQFAHHRRSISQPCTVGLLSAPRSLSYRLLGDRARSNFHQDPLAVPLIENEVFPRLRSTDLLNPRVCLIKRVRRFYPKCTSIGVHAKNVEGRRSSHSRMLYRRAPHICPLAHSSKNGVCRPGPLRSETGTAANHRVPKSERRPPATTGENKAKPCQ
jgi:hypothetical protein